MATGFTQLCALLTVMLVGVMATHSAALGVDVIIGRSSSSSHAAILRIEASEVQSIPLSSNSGEYNDHDYDDDDHDGASDYNPSNIYYGGGAGNGFGDYPGIIFDDSSDSDDDSDSDIRISISGDRSHDVPHQQRKRFTLARQWHLFPASAGRSYAWFTGDGSFQLELQVPGQVFVHVLKDDPDYHVEKKKSKDGTTLVAKVVATANDSALLNGISVVEGSQGWSVVSRSSQSSLAIDGLVVYVYLNGEIGKHLVSVVSKGAGDVVLTKKVVPTSAIAFAISSLGNGGMYLHTSSKLSFVSLALHATGSSSVYLYCSSTVSITNEIAVTVDGSSSIAVKAASFSTTQLTTTVTNGGDICLAATKLLTTTLNASVVQNGSITTSVTHGSSFSEFIEIDGKGVVDTGVVNSMRTSVSVRGGPGDVTVGSGFKLEYSAPATSHVRYRGSRPTMVVVRDDPAAPGTSSAQLEKQSSSSRKKCPLIIIPSEPEAVSLINKNAGAASTTAIISVSSPSPPYHVIEDLSSPAAIKSRGFNDPQELVAPKFPDAATQTPSSTPAVTFESADPQLNETLPPSVTPTNLPSALPSPELSTVLPSPASAVTPSTTSPSPEPLVSTRSSSPPPVPSGVPSTTLLPTPTLAPSLPPATTNSTLPANSITTPTSASTRASGLLAKVVDYTLPIGTAFVAFIWFLHLVLQCCDRRSRRRQYQAINASNPASVAGQNNEDPPVLI